MFFSVLLGNATARAQSFSFDRERTEKINMEPSQLSDPSAPPPSDPKSKTQQKAGLSPAEVAKIKKELIRLRGLVENSMQMLEDAEDNQSARVKILGTIKLLEVEIRKLNAQLNGAAPAQDTPMPTPAPTPKNEIDATWP